MKYHGVSPQRFPHDLKELEFRYNHRKENLFPLITKYLCNLVPQNVTNHLKLSWSQFPRPS